MNPLLKYVLACLGLAAVILAAVVIVGSLAGCHVTRAFSTAEAPAGAQPIDCGTWVDCA